MSWKSRSPRSPPQSGISRLSKISSERRRNLVIHSGSFLIMEISRTTSALRPFLGSNT